MELTEKIIKSFTTQEYFKNRDEIKSFYKTLNQNILKVKQEYYKKYHFQHRRKTQVAIKITKNLRSRIRQALKGERKSQRTLQLLGCSIEELRTHLENQFQPGMSFNNYGKWHIDHKKPCASFDLRNPEDQAKCFHFTNLQPLWAKENMKKGCKIF